MISIEKYSDKWVEQVKALSVKPEQVAFTVSDINGLLSRLTVLEHPCLIIKSNQVVGFFLLDLGYSDTYHFSDKAIGIRSLLIDQRFQGQGIATKAINLLPSYVHTHYPQFKLLQLTVNCRNQAAHQCYCKCGFETLPDLYLGGPVGPQYVMQRHLVE